jgi:proline dehydrogenase
VQARGCASTSGFWSQGIEDPVRIARAHLGALEAFPPVGLDWYPSVKAPPLASRPDLLTEIVRRAAAAGVRVHFDALAPERAKETLALVADARRHGAELGVTLPARWHRSVADAEAAIELGVAVRVVKGEWPDRVQPEPEPHEGFLALIDRLAGRATHVAVATHDAALARKALTRLRAAGTACELEVLFGRGLGPATAAARAQGAPVRVYVPYGRGDVPYAMADAARDPRVLAYFAQDLVLGPRKGWRRLPVQSRPSRTRA